MPACWIAWQLASMSGYELCPIQTAVIYVWLDIRVFPCLPDHICVVSIPDTSLSFSCMFCAHVMWRHLSLSSNSTERMVRLELPRLRILSLGRNRIKRIDGLQAIAGTLEQIWLSYNEISNLDGVLCCGKLKTLYISHNKIKSWEEIAKLVCILWYLR